MLEGCVDEEGSIGGNGGEKKRRLSIEQVKALEKNFEVENKLEPERKVKLAQELGLLPRQVSVWFQNRRARWKTKQLERDYGVLKANFDDLKHNYESLLHDKEALLLEIKELKSKLEDDGTETNLLIKEENLASEAVEMLSSRPNSLTLESQFNFTEYKLDGPSDSSDSSADDQSLNASNSSSGVVQNDPNGFSFNRENNVYKHAIQFVKMEEQHNFFGDDEACNLFSEEPPPTLSWYNADQWT